MSVVGRESTARPHDFFALSGCPSTIPSTFAMPGWSSDDQARVLPPPANPFLREPLLYVGGLTENVPDEAIVEVLEECLRVRIDIQRTSGSAYATAEGTVAFESLDRGEELSPFRAPQLTISSHSREGLCDGQRQRSP